MPEPESPVVSTLTSRWKRLVLARSTLVAGGLVLAVIGLSGLGWWVTGGGAARVDQRLTRALELLEAGEFEQARQITEAAIRGGRLTAEQRGLAAYVLGLTLVRLECDSERQADRRTGLYMVAAGYFDEAALQGVPPEIQAQLDYWEGRSHILAGQEIRARGALLRALESNPQRRNEILLWLGQVYLADQQLPKEPGLEYLEQLLADPQLAAAERERGVALQVQLYLANQQVELAEGLLERLPEDSPTMIGVRIALGQYYIRRADSQRQERQPQPHVEATYRQAIAALQVNRPTLLAEDDLNRGRSLFWLAKAQMGAGEMEAAVENFTYVRRQFFDQPVGIAAGFWEAQCLLEADDAANAARLFSALLREVMRPNVQGESEWLNQHFLSQMMERAVQSYLSRDDCQTALSLADEFRTVSQQREPPIPLGLAANLRAQILQKWVTKLEDQVKAASYADRPAIEQTLREKYLEFAHTRYSLAIHRYATEDFTGDLFQAGQYFYLAEDFQRAIWALRHYLAANETRWAAQARLRIGQSHMALRQYQDAVETLTHCWTLFPTDPVVYQARIHAAESYLELGQPESAAQILRANLDSDTLTPRSQEWIESLFLLGQLLLDQGKTLESQGQVAADPRLAASKDGDAIQLIEKSAEYYSQAIARLSEAVQRAPESPRALWGTYALAEAYRRSNRWHEIQLSLTTVSARRNQINDRIRRYDEQAIVYFNRLEQQLLELKEWRALEENEERLLRNSYFLRGNLHFRLNQFESAIQMYRTVSNLVIQEPEVLEAYVQIASCYRQLNRHEEAIRVVQQAKILLRDRIPPAADFEATTRFSRERWVTLLDWLATI